MIKAEVISHEGNPGPNWLEHCKALITPWSITVAVLVAAILFVVAATNQRSDVGIANQTSATSKQTAHLNPLAVSPVTSASNVTQAATDASVQAAPESGASQLPSNKTANVLGAKATPSLNTAKSTGSADNSDDSAANPDTVTAQKLSKNVQTTITSSSETVHKTLKAITDTLDL